MTRGLGEAGLVGGALGTMILVLSAVVGVAGTAASDLTIATIFLGAASGAAAGVVAVLVAGATSLEGDLRLVGGPYDLEVDSLVSEWAIVALQMAQQ